MNDRDRALEDAAQAIEHPDFAEWDGAFSSSKAGKREYDIRSETIRDTKKRMAAYIRSMKSEQSKDIRMVLARVAEDLRYPVDDVREAWQLADLGWVNIFITVNATDTAVPSKAEHRLELTIRGQNVLNELRRELRPRPDDQAPVGVG